MLTTLLAQENPMSMLDAVLFVVAVVAVIGLGIYKARPPKKDSEIEKKGDSAADYFLAGRGLSWWLVGFSLIAANISTEQFVGMSGQAADWLGLAIAGYEWLAAIVLVLVAFFFLPKLLRCGVYTIPEFLETRFNVASRSVMALSTLLILVGVPTAGVIFAGAKVISVFFLGPDGCLGIDFGSIGIVDGNILVGCIIIALCAAVYVFVGGLKACAWTDLIWGSALILGGGVVTYLAITRLGVVPAEELIQTKAATSGVTVEQLQNMNGVERLLALNSGEAVDGANTIGGKFHMIRPASDSSMPWTVLLLGLWIPNFFYWGLNQYIMQRTLASKSVAEGQLGIVFAAFLKLLIPFVVVIPGIMAYNLFSGDLKSQADIKNTATLEAHKDCQLCGLGENGAAAGTLYEFTGGFAQIDANKHDVFRMLNHNSLVITGHFCNDEAIAGVWDKVYSNKNCSIADAQMLADLNKSTFIDKKNPEHSVAQRIIGYDYDAAFPTLLKNLMSPGITWFVLAALFGAVVSSLASMLNSASTIFTMDIYNKLRKGASQSELVTVGKAGVVVCVLIAMGLAPFLNSPVFGGIFTFIQEFQGFISPGVLCVFLFGFFVPKCPRVFGWLGILANAVLYGALKYTCPEMAFLNRMSVCLIACFVLGLLLTLVNIKGEAVEVPAKNEVPLESSKGAKFFGAIVIIATIVLYALFF